YGASLWFRRVVMAKAAAWLLLAAFVLPGTFMLVVWFLTGRTPVVTAFDTLSFLAWIVAGAYLFFQLRTKTRVLGAFVSPLCLFLILAASPGIGQFVPLPASLQGGMVSLHIILTITGEALFVVASLAGLMYLLQDNLLKRRKSNPFIRYLPPLHDLDRINANCLLLGFPFMTLGLIIGSLWATVTWGNPWPLDAKFVWSLTAWFIYAALLHQRLAIGWQGRKVAFYSVAAFLFLVVTFIAEKTFFSTMHTFF
ncbi:MAG: cytochrome c biogenesis protein, partial [Syntrophales bacterium]|nr:cytochrome c biogenesis protein [Syntrophales bacterium]